jgi:hypothetical protein
MLDEVDAATDVVRSILAIVYWFSLHSPVDESRSGLCCVEGGRTVFQFRTTTDPWSCSYSSCHPYVYVRFIITIILIIDSILDTHVCIMIIAEYLIQRDIISLSSSRISSMVIKTTIKKVRKVAKQ